MKVQVSYNVNGWLERVKNDVLPVLEGEENVPEMNWRFPSHVYVGQKEDGTCLYAILPLECVHNGMNGFIVHKIID